MKPGDTVQIRQSQGFVTLFEKPGPVGITVGGGTQVREVVRMTPESVGLVIAVINYVEELTKADVAWEECLIMVPMPEGATLLGWRETDQFRVL